MVNIVEGIELKPCRSHGKCLALHKMLCEEDIPVCETNLEGGSVQNMVLFNKAVLMNLKYIEVILCSSVVAMQLSCT